MNIVDPPIGPSYTGTYRSGGVRLDEAPDWPDGTRVVIRPAPLALPPLHLEGHVIIVGFGLAGRYVADLLDSERIPYAILEKNPETVETQSALGRRVHCGDATDTAALTSAGLASASILALTIPDEEAVLEATALVRGLRPEIYIIARTNYASKGMRASQLGADDVIKAEHAVALLFYEKLRKRLAARVPVPV